MRRGFEEDAKATNLRNIDMIDAAIDANIENYEE